VHLEFLKCVAVHSLSMSEDGPGRHGEPGGTGFPGTRSSGGPSRAGGYGAVASDRCGSFHPGRTKWHVYPLGIRWR